MSAAAPLGSPAAAPRERPILFSGEMVRAVLEGRKTQTRRLVKIPRHDDVMVWRYVRPPEFEGWRFEELTGRDRTSHDLRCPYGAPGDLLWAKEVWRPQILHTCAADACDCADVTVTYAADASERLFYEEAVPDEWLMPKAAKRGHVSPLFMPRWASRITLEVVDIWVERLQSISEEDSLAEGLRRNMFGTYWCGAPHKAHGFPRQHNTAREAYADLWDELNGKRAPWASNPWVWVVEFRRLETGGA